MSIKKIIFFLTIFSSIFANSSYLLFGSGVCDLLRDRHRTLEFLIEYRFKSSFLKIHPFLGTKTNIKGASYTYFGFIGDIFLKDIFISPSLAMGYYKKSKGKDLGYPLEFRSCIYLGYRFKNLSRFGFGFYHISNASLGSRNPGEECLIAFYALSF